MRGFPAMLAAVITIAVALPLIGCSDGDQNRERPLSNEEIFGVDPPPEHFTTQERIAQNLRGGLAKYQSRFPGGVKILVNCGPRVGCVAKLVSRRNPDLVLATNTYARSGRVIRHECIGSFLGRLSGYPRRIWHTDEKCPPPRVRRVGDIQ